MLDWDLVRYFLAVARTGSTLAAAEALKQSQPTVARRIDALERSLGTSLFDRRMQGYRLTAVGKALLPSAEAVEGAAMRFEAKAGADARRVAGTIRFTTFDMFANITLGRLLQEFGRLHPDVRVEVMVTDRLLDLGAGEADVAVRSGARPEAGQLVYRSVGRSDWTAYCSKAYAAANGHPRTPAEIDGHVLIGGEGGLANVPAMRWLMEAAPHSEVRYRSNTVENLMSSIRAGLGIGMLPCAFVPPTGNLLACVWPPPPELASEAWLVTHERVRNQPHIRAFMGFLPKFLEQRVPRNP
jgi:DNA-binding transcriptional LysR family regulator